MFGIDSDPDRPEPDRHALDADPDQDPAKWCGTDPIRILIHIHLKFKNKNHVSRFFINVFTFRAIKGTESDTRKFPGKKPDPSHKLCENTRIRIGPPKHTVSHRGTSRPNRWQVIETYQNYQNGPLCTFISWQALHFRIHTLFFAKSKFRRHTWPSVKVS